MATREGSTGEAQRTGRSGAKPTPASEPTLAGIGGETVTQAPSSETASPSAETTESGADVRGSANERATAVRRARASGESISPEARRQMIAEAAYYRAQQRGFTSGYELEDWLQAEQEIDAALSE